MRLRLLGVFGLLLTLGCMCSDMGALQQGMDQALVQNLQELEGKLLALPPSANHKEALHLCSRAQAEAAAGNLELVETSVWMVETEAALADGTISDDELSVMSRSFDALISK